MFSPIQQQYQVLTEMRNGENSEEAECCSFLLLACVGRLVHPQMINVHKINYKNSATVKLTITLLCYS